VDEQAVTAWLDGYSRAWESYDPERIGALFAEDAVYRYDPFDEPVRGREAIVASWLEERDDQGSYQGRYRPRRVAGDRAVANGYSRYFHPDGSLESEFDNLLLLRFDADGRCVDYREWYMKKPDEAGPD
jgi:uncharacterized protein (TIGR02246 family)